MRETRKVRNAQRRGMMSMIPFRKTLTLLTLLAGAGCASARPATSARTAPPVNTSQLSIAADAVADSLLEDVRSLDPTIVVELRYATANNFTGAPLPGYQGSRAFLRREAARALTAVRDDVRKDGLSLKVFD